MKTAVAAIILAFLIALPDAGAAGIKQTAPTNKKFGGVVVKDSGNYETCMDCNTAPPLRPAIKLKSRTTVASPAGLRDAKSVKPKGLVPLKVGLGSRKTVGKAAAFEEGKARSVKIEVFSKKYEFNQTSLSPKEVKQLKNLPHGSYVVVGSAGAKGREDNNIKVASMRAQTIANLLRSGGNKVTTGFSLRPPYRRAVVYATPASFVSEVQVVRPGSQLPFPSLISKEDVRKNFSVMYAAVAEQLMEFSPSVFAGIYKGFSCTEGVFFFAPDKGILLADPNREWVKTISTKLKAKFAEKCRVRLAAAEAKKFANTLSTALLWSEVLKTINPATPVKVGNGAVEMLEVSDPECPWCAKASRWLDEQEGITRLIILQPNHATSGAEAGKILCSKNQSKTYREMLEKHGESTTTIECEAAVAAHHSAAVALGVKGTPTFFIKIKDRAVRVDGANIKLLQKLINEAKEVRDEK